MIVNNRTIKCTIKEKDDARDDYDDAMAQGQATLLAETSDSGDVLIFNLGIVPPMGTITVKVTYVIEVVVQPGFSLKKGTITIPQTVIPLTKVESSAFSSELDLAQKTTFDADCEVNVTTSDSVVLKVASKPEEIRSDVVIEVTRPGDKPFDVSSISITETRTESPSEHYSVSIPVSGQFLESTGSPPQILFLIDRSVSADILTSAQRCMETFLDSLDNCAFNIIKFGSSFEPLFKDKSDSLVYNAADSKSLTEAKKYVSQIKVDAATSDLEGPLKTIQNSTSDPTQVIFLTDGVVGQATAALEKAFAVAEDVRITCIGLGYSCSRDLVQSLARYTGGRCYFIRNPEAEVSKLQSIMHQSVQPILHDLSLNILAEIDGFKPCFSIHRDSHLSLVSADSREMLFGFAPDYFEPDQLTSDNLFLEGGFVVKCDPKTGYSISDNSVGAVMSEQVLKDNYIETTQQVKSAIVRHALQSGMSKKSLSDLFPSPTDIKKQGGKALKINFTDEGSITIGDSPKCSYNRTAITIKTVKSVKNISLRQSDGSEKLIPVSDETLEAFQTQCLLYMPLPKSDLSYTKDANDEVHRNYSTIVVDDNRINQLTAAKRIQEIEDMQRIGLYGDELTPEAVRLSISHNVLSKYTAFIAVDEDGSAQPVTMIKKIDVIPLVTESSSRSIDYTEVEERRSSPVATRSARSAVKVGKRKESEASGLRSKALAKKTSIKEESPPLVPSSAPVPAGRSSAAPSYDIGSREDYESYAPLQVEKFDDFPQSLSVPPGILPQGIPLGDPVGDIVRLQCPDGSWLPTPQLFALLLLPVDYNATVHAITATVVRHLQTVYAMQGHEWGLAVERATAFLTQAGLGHLVHQVPVGLEAPAFAGHVGNYEHVDDGDAL
eukprot:TRINITY_DN10792_c1_g1_i3.p1 TRINITY_DN10792_c1_g1~~TRINITY_DN10792_c1_g1_i3.p1  ORF type:complete len:890 (+),score=153.89 TRINITY_DN10792_c1_g1_i3:221-2890(+)